MMRIISGVRRGKRLVTLEGDNTRPTLERVKQAFFNAIQFEIQDRTVLDLFAGSGQLGLEALSRGAKFCYFNDMSDDACRIIQKNINLCDFVQMSQLTCKTHMECVKIINRGNRKISLVFLDPPYGKGLIAESLDIMRESGILSEDAVIVCESAADDIIYAEGFEVRKEYRYSAVKVTIMQMKE